MEYQEYINQKKEIYKFLYQFITEENDEEENYQLFIENFYKQKIEESKEELGILLRVFLNIFNHHHRSPNFSTKMFKILAFLTKTIKQIFTNIEIFRLFQSNRMIILHLIDQNIITVDEQISKEIVELSQGHEWSYKYFFYPEIKPFISSEENTNIESFFQLQNCHIFDNIDIFYENRHKGENDSMISSLIRNDSASEFVTFISQTNLSKSSLICDSIFESNSILNERPPTLIEYATFYGSIQIIKYLWLNKVELTSSLWIYGIHSNNADVIHFLEENHVPPPNDSYQECLNQSIECHHNEISEYIRNQILITEKSYGIEIEKNKFKKITSSFNFSEMPSEINNQFLFFYLCFYGYSYLVDLYIKPKINKAKEQIIQKYEFHNKIRNIIE